MAGHESLLYLSWYDSAWIPILNQHNVMDYFSERSNPFYDRQCNNEVIKMQRLNPEQIRSMTGIEYELLHAMEPILYVIRKQNRHSPAQVVPITDYYIIAGIVYQAPDLISVINARLLNAVHNLEMAFEEAQSFSRYHPSKGYWWQFKDGAESEIANQKEKKRRKEEPSSLFQRQRVDMLLTELAQKFPPKSFPAAHQVPPVIASAVPSDKIDDVKVEPKVEVKVEKTTERSITNQGGSSKAPPEKKPKLIR